MKLNRTPNELDRRAQNGENDNWDKIEGAVKDVKNVVDDFIGTVSDEVINELIDNAQLNWKEPVDSFINLPSGAQKGDTRMAKDTGKVYRFDGDSWIEIQQIDAGPVNELDIRLSSQLAENESDIAILKKIETSIENYPRFEGELDDAPRINRAISEVGEDGVLTFPPGTSYIIGSESVIFTCHVVGTGASFITDGPYGVEIGKVGTNYIVSGKTIRLPIIIQNNKSWSGNDVGVIAHNLNSCDVFIPIIRYFSVGLEVTATNTGSVYNNFKVLHYQNNRVNIKISPREGGWVNENSYYSGRYSHESNEGVKVTGARHILIENTSIHTPNNNIFYKPSIEGNTAEYSIECQGNYNMFIAPRFEGINQTVLYSGSGAHSNTIFYGYDSHRLEILNENGALYNHFYTRNGSSIQGGGQKGVFAGSNNSSNIYPIFAGYSSGSKGVVGASPEEYLFAISGNTSKYKRATDEYPRLQINHSTGEVLTGSGSTEPSPLIRNNGLVFGDNNEVTIQSFGANARIRGGNLIHEGGWNQSHFVLGNLHMWVDDDGNLRVKNGKPTRASDGSIVVLEN